MKSWFSKLFRYFAELIKWATPLRLVLLPICIFLLSIGCLWIPVPSERKFRLCGAMLQLGGVILAGVDLYQKGTVFDDIPSVWERAKTKWSQRPRFSPQAIHLQASGVALGVTGMKAHMTIQAGPKATIEHRVEILEKNITHLTDEVAVIERNLGGKLNNLSNKLEAARDEQQAAARRTHEQLRRSVAEGIPLGWIGVLFFLFGIVISTTSPELACLLLSDCS